MCARSSRLLTRGVRLTCLATLTLMTACASAPPDYATQTKDPWEKLNRATFTFNDKFDRAIGRPVARTYIRAVPQHARTGIHNFIENLSEPVDVANDILQGQGKQTLKDTGRFLINTTFGLLGFFDVAAHVGLPEHDEDLGQTLAHWGVPSGPYLVLPILGPSTVRDAGGRYADTYLNPVWDNMQSRYGNGAYLMEGVDTRADLMDLNATLDSAYDPYTFMRDAYIQHRRYEIYDGNPPIQYPDYPDLPADDDSGDDAAPASSTATPPASATSPQVHNKDNGG